MKRREFLGRTAAGALGVLGAGRSAGQTPGRPNILVFMADDLGYGDLGCFGGRQSKTPTLDGLAAEGMRFTDFYAAAPNCSPSRAAMLTGRFPARAGLYSYVPPEGPMHLRSGELTTAAILRAAGYDTAHIGKWHLCNDLLSGAFPSPKAHGFDYWFATRNNAMPSHRNPENFVRNGKAVGTVEGYACQIVADEAIGWLDGGRDTAKPFFLNVWFHEPHRKVAAPRELEARHEGTMNAAYYACIENMDAAIGRVLEKLEELGLAGETLVVFTSDNGSYLPSSNGGLREGKSFVFEGGIREPAIMRWPGRIAPASVSAFPGSGVDLLPTLCEITGTAVPKDRPIDGISLAAVFDGRSPERKTPLFWFFYRTDPACALREGDWSLVGHLDGHVPKAHAFCEEAMVYIRRSKPVRFALFNLKEDPGQAKDVAKEHPERVAAMSERMVALHAEVVREGFAWY